jgi:hypothetical protein
MRPPAVESRVGPKHSTDGTRGTSRILLEGHPLSSMPDHFPDPLFLIFPGKRLGTTPIWVVGAGSGAASSRSGINTDRECSLLRMG